MAIRTLFLDAVGTLFGLRQTPGQTYADFAQRHGIHVDPEKAAAAFLQSWKTASPPVYTVEDGRAEEAPPESRERVDRLWWLAIVRNCLEAAAIDDDVPEDSAVERCFDEIFAHYGTAQPWRVYSDTVEVLPRLRRGGFRLVVLSNFDARLNAVMDSLGLTPLVDQILYSSALGACKPSPVAFERALNAANTTPAEALHVGDDPKTDGQGAAAAGLPFFHLERPGNDLHSLAQHLGVS